MCSKFLMILLFCIGAALAFPDTVIPLRNGGELKFKEEKPNPPQFTAFNGGGNRETGYNVNTQIRAPAWTSDNGRHSVDVSGGYSQHLGGPYGNSDADKRGGASYTFRW